MMTRRWMPGAALIVDAGVIEYVKPGIITRVAGVLPFEGLAWTWPGRG